MKTQFLLEDVSTVDYDGQMAFMAPLPNEVTKLQRRRILPASSCPVRRQSAARCTATRTAQPLPYKCTTSSLGGLSLVLNTRIPGFDIGTIYNNCELDLREYGVIPLVLKVRNQLVARSTSGANNVGWGVEFVELDSRAQTLVQRYRPVPRARTPRHGSRRLNTPSLRLAGRHTGKAVCRPWWNAGHPCAPWLSSVIGDKVSATATILAEPAH